MKYVVVKNEDTETEEIYLFPRFVNHDDFADITSYIKMSTGRDWTRSYRIPVSAGFVDASFQCSGRSETLDLDSRNDVDTKLLQDSFYRYTI